MRLGKGLFGWFLFIALSVMLVMLLNKNESTFAQISITDFVNRLESDKIRWVEVGKDELHGEFFGVETIAGDKVGKFRVTLPENSTGGWAFNEWLLDHSHSATISASRDPNLLTNILVPLIPWLLIFGFIWFFVFRQLRKTTELHQARAKEPMRVIVVNLPGEPPLAQEATTPPPR